MQLHAGSAGVHVGLTKATAVELEKYPGADIIDYTWGSSFLSNIDESG